MQKITPFLWFDAQAEEAINFYVDVFNGNPRKKSESKIVSIKRYPGGYSEGPMAGMEGKILTAIIELDGQRVMALDGGPIFKFNEAVSLYVTCADQEELDYFWEKLSAVPESEQCGWLKDKYGLSWQIIPKSFEEFASQPDTAQAKRVMDAVLQMKKIDIKKLEEAAKS